MSAFEGRGSIPPLNPDRGDDPGVAVLAFRAAIGAADAVLLAAPEYAGAIAGERLLGVRCGRSAP